MKNFGDAGSIVPLNINQREIVSAPIEKSETHAQRIERASREGTPITRRGMYNGVMPATQPGIPASMNPSLFISKAVINPADAGTGSGDSVSRKRDNSTGKFTEKQDAGPQTTATDDLANQQRTARLAERRYLKALGVPESPMPNKPPGNPMADAGIPGSPPGQGGAPGAPPAPPAADGQQEAPPDPNSPQAAPQVPPMPGEAPMEQPMGTSPDGTPIFSDPYHEAHSSFSPEQHDAASQLHQQMAEQMTGQGRIPTAMEHQMKAAIHGEMGRDAMSPMTRMAMDQQGVQGLSAQPGEVPEMTGAALPPGAGGPNSNPAMGGQAGDAMDQFLTNLPDQIPGAQNKPMGPNQAQDTASQVAGPEPRMMNTYTGGPIGPLTPPQNHAGTFPEQQPMPPSPPPGAGSMPQIGQGQDGGGMPGEQPGMAPPGGDGDGDENMPPGSGDNDGDEMGAGGPGLEEAGLQGGDSFDWDPSQFDAANADPSDVGDTDMEADVNVDDEDGEGGEPVADNNPQDADGPTPGAGESEPGRNAGPSTEDKAPVPPKGKEEAAFKSWFSTI